MATSDSLIRVCDATSGKVLVTCNLHKSTITAIKFFPRQELVVSGDDAGNILIWNAASGELRQRLTGHSAGINGLAVTAEGERIASASNDRTVKVWDWASDKLPQTFDGFRDEVRSIDYSPDGSLLAAAGREGLVRLWNASTLDELEPIHGYRGSYALRFLSDGRLTFPRPDDRQTICRVDRRATECALTPRAAVENVVLARTPEHLHIAACSVQDRKSPTIVHRYRVDRENVTELSPFLPGVRVGCLAISSRGVWVIGDADGTTVLLSDDLVGTNLTRHTASAGKGASSAAFSADGSRLAVGFSDGYVGIWNLSKQDLAWTAGNAWRVHDAAVTSLGFHPRESTTLVTGSRDRTVKTWNYENATPSRSPWTCQNWVFSVAISPAGDTLAVSHFDRYIDILNWQTGGHSILRGHSTGAVESLAFLSDQRTLISESADQTLKVWDVPTGRERFTLDGSPKTFRSLAISPDETVIAAGTRDGTIRLFRRATDKEVEAAGW